MIRKYVLLGVLAALICLPASAWAHDLLPPSWRGRPGTSVARWDSWSGCDSFWSYDGSLSAPEYHYESGWNYYEGPWFLEDGIFRVPYSSRYQRLAFELDNYDDNRPWKDIRVQVTLYGAGYNFEDYYLSVWTWADPSEWEDPMPGGDVEAILSATEPVEVAGQPGWFVLAFDLRMWPNPDRETIGLQFLQGPFYNVSGQYTATGGNVWVGQVVIDTYCVPEPATLMLLALGGLAVIRRKKR